MLRADTAIAPVATRHRTAVGSPAVFPLISQGAVAVKVTRFVCTGGAIETCRRVVTLVCVVLAA